MKGRKERDERKEGKMKGRKERDERKEEER